MDPQMIIADIIAAITALGGPGLDLFLKLKALFNLGPDQATNIANLVQQALTVDQDTIDRIEAWKKANGVS